MYTFKALLGPKILKQTQPMPFRFGPHKSTPQPVLFQAQLPLPFYLVNRYFTLHTNTRHKHRQTLEEFWRLFSLVPGSIRQQLDKVTQL